MSLVFNHLPAKVSRALNVHATRERRTVEQVAIAALERGLAFEEESTDEETLWAESEQFDEALRAFAAMERE